MNKYLKAFLVSGGVLVLLIFTFLIWKDKSKPKESINELNFLERMENEGVPNFSAKTIYGRSVEIFSLKGNVVIINFWASWCGPCVEEVPSLIELVQAFGGKVQLVAVSGDSTTDDIEIFMKSFPKLKNDNIHIVWDQDHSIMKTYNVERLPESFVVNGKGKLVKKVVGTINWHTQDSEDYIRDLLSK